MSSTDLNYAAEVAAIVISASVPVLCTVALIVRCILRKYCASEPVRVDMARLPRVQKLERLAAAAPVV